MFNAEGMAEWSMAVFLKTSVFKLTDNPSEADRVPSPPSRILLRASVDRPLWMLSASV